jgi:ABC-2 type transport system ATP-binding protein
LEFVELREHRRKLARNLSGGMHRRLSLAATLVHSPELIFLDEPTAGIDPVLRRKFWGYFEELRDAGKTLFITTQYIAEAVYCDMVGIMREGKILVTDTPEGLRRRALGGDVIWMGLERPIDYLEASRLSRLPFVLSKAEFIDERTVSVVVDDASTSIPALIEWCGEQQIAVDTIQEHSPPFDDIYVSLLRRYGENE